MDKCSVPLPKRLNVLYKVIAILTAIAHKLGILIDTVAPIKIKSHGRKAKSYILLALENIFNARKFLKRLTLQVLETINTFFLTLNSLSFFDFCHVH
jgi:hypothetical protein